MKLSDEPCGSPAGAGGEDLRPVGRRRLLRGAALAAAALIAAPRRGLAEPRQGVGADGLIAERRFATGDVSEIHLRALFRSEKGQWEAFWSQN